MCNSIVWQMSVAVIMVSLIGGFLYYWGFGIVADCCIGMRIIEGNCCTRRSSIKGLWEDCSSNRGSISWQIAVLV